MRVCVRQRLQIFKLEAWRAGGLRRQGPGLRAEGLRFLFSLSLFACDLATNMTNLVTDCETASSVLGLRLDVPSSSTPRPPGPPDSCLWSSTSWREKTLGPFGGLVLGLGFGLGVFTSATNFVTYEFS